MSYAYQIGLLLDVTEELSEAYQHSVESNCDGTKLSMVDGLPETNTDQTEVSMIDDLQETGLSSTKQSTVNDLPETNPDPTRRLMVDDIQETNPDFAEQSTVDNLPEKSLDTVCNGFSKIPNNIYKICLIVNNFEIYCNVK